MTKSRRAAAEPGRTRNRSLVQLLAEAKTTDDIVEACGLPAPELSYPAKRKAVGAAFQASLKLRAGEEGDKLAAYQCKTHWALLDMIALQAHWNDLAFSAITRLAREVAAGEKRARSIGRKTLDSLHAEQIDDRRIRLAFRDGDEEAAVEFVFPVMIDRGLWSERASYERGDAVSVGGNLWVAQTDDPAGRPGDPASGWRLAVKAGRNGKDYRA